MWPASVRARRAAGRRALRTGGPNLRWASLELDRVKIVPGFFQETLKGRSVLDLGIESVTVAVIDMAASTTSANDERFGSSSPVIRRSKSSRTGITGWPRAFLVHRS